MTERPAILIVEDDAILAESLVTRLRLEGMEPIAAGSCAEALALLDARGFDAVVSDIRLPDGSGEEIFWSQPARFAMTPTIFTTAYGEIEQAVRLVRLGAVDYLAKPHDVGELVTRLRRVTGMDRDATTPDDAVVAASRRMAEAVDLADRAAATRHNVLLIGAPGVGKRRLAERIHRAAAGDGAPFVEIDGASLTAERGDRLLFGVRDGSAPETDGLLDEIGAGTLAISRIEDIPDEARGRLARFFETRRFRPIGASAERTFEGRIIGTATAARIEAEGGEHADFFDRFATIAVRVPPLCERPQDVRPLAERLLGAEIATNLDGPSAFSGDALAALEAHDWPGNVRELRNRIVRAVLTRRSGPIEVADLFPDRAVDDTPHDLRLDAARRDAERQAIEAALAENRGRIVETAKALGISRVTLWSKMRRFDIAKP
jgi:DNA-binding NtrC family response regulator